mmetsp:Transcript_16448/g.32685  ORF Transcript_16448/g.32685 Transcript_16448/m.32685 type:complete len:690 (+) Transcript_16448:36-2105(+)
MNSAAIPNTGTPSRSLIRRSVAHPDAGPRLSLDGCHTLYECLRRGAVESTLHGPCLGYRAVPLANGGDAVATPYVYSTYGEVLTRVDNLSAGLAERGLVSYAVDGTTKFGAVGLYLKNCPEWVIVEHACYSVGAATVPMYDTLGPETVQYILQHTDLETVVCASGGLAALVAAKEVLGAESAFRTVVLVDGVTARSAALATSQGLECVSLAKIESIGSRAIDPSDPQGHHTPPSGGDVATLCYTSGTTGTPKGALLTHRNFLASMAGVAQHGGEAVKACPSDRHLSYLPLPHIFERIFLSQFLHGGASVAFLSGTTDTLVADWVACRPTLAAVVPRVLNKIHDKIQAGMEAKGGVALKMFRAALHTKTRTLLEGDGSTSHALWDALIFNKIKKGLGLDCVRLLVSGSAPLSPTVMTFYRVLFSSCNVVEGYGQTEGTAAASITIMGDNRTVGHVGAPIPGVEVVLMDIPEMGYLSTDTDHRGAPCVGRGEICIRGPCVFSGYFKQPDATAEAIDAEGWLHSGDVGLYTLEGDLKIIDRKKNIFKLAQGEYVAAEKIENCLMQSTLIGQCFVYGDSFQNFLVAVVVPDEDVVKTWAAASDPPVRGSFSDLCGSQLLVDAIMADVRRVSASAQLQGFEVVRNVFCTNELFAVENGLVTPTFKLKRKQLKEYFERDIARMYAQAPLPRKSAL